MANVYSVRAKGEMCIFDPTRQLFHSNPQTLKDQSYCEFRRYLVMNFLLYNSPSDNVRIHTPYRISRREPSKPRQDTCR